MIKHLLLWTGKANRRDPESELAQRYLDRIAPYATMEVRAVKPIKSGDPAQVRRKETASVMAAIDRRDWVTVLDERGKQLRSRGLAEYISNRGPGGEKRMVWVIGGAMGVGEALRQRADFVLSLSELTLPHALARVVFLEQIYRASCILAGHPYHHEG